MVRILFAFLSGLTCWKMYLCEEIMNVCYYCNSCKRCEKFHFLRNELEKKGFNSFNKNVPFWKVCKDPFPIELLPLDLRM